jgi:hypothetical protein
MGRGDTIASEPLALPFLDGVYIRRPHTQKQQNGASVTSRRFSSLKFRLPDPGELGVVAISFFLFIRLLSKNISTFSNWHSCIFFAKLAGCHFCDFTELPGEIIAVLVTRLEGNFRNIHL